MVNLFFNKNLGLKNKDNILVLRAYNKAQPCLAVYAISVTIAKRRVATGASNKMSKISEKEPFIYDFGEHNGKIPFSDKQEFISFLEKERESYLWLQKTDSGKEIFHIINNCFNSTIETTEKNKLFDSSLIKLLNKNNNSHTRAGYSFNTVEIYKNRNLPLSSKAEFITIDGIRKENPERAALAIRFWTNLGFDPTVREAFYVGHNISHYLNQMPDVSEPIRGNLESLVSEYKQEILKLNTEGIEAIMSIKQTEETYREYMKLGASIDYWQKKRRGHAIRVWICGILLILFGLFGGGGLLYSLWFLVNYVIDLNTSLSNPVYFIYATLAVSGTTIVFWIGRILSRLYLSQYHLALDASERTTMIGTYLAMLDKGAVTEAERAIVLATLFRPTEDGIVKDDAAPDLSLSAVLAKVGSG